MLKQVVHIVTKLNETVRLDAVTVIKMYIVRCEV
jgi:hypothetical protein